MIVAKSLISVGLPVFNGEEFVDNVIESVLEQDYRELELIICDNASSDATARICQEWAERDNRVRYYRNEENIGALANFERTLKLASGSYFNWVGHDDALDPTYLSEVVTYLEEHPDVVLCASDFRGVDRQLGVHDQCLDSLYPTIPWRKVRKGFFDGTSDSMRYNSVYGLFRHEVMVTVPLTEGPAPGKDALYLWEVPFLARIASHGKVVALPKVLRTMRWRVGSLGWQVNSARTLGESLAVERSVKRRNFRIAAKASLPLLEKAELVLASALSFLQPSLFIRRTVDMIAAQHRASRDRLRVIQQLEMAAEERLRCIGHLNEEIELLTEKLGNLMNQGQAA